MQLRTASALLLGLTLVAGQHRAQSQQRPEAFIPGIPTAVNTPLNLVGAIRTCMGSVGAASIRELQQTELIIAPAIKTEGKVFQQAQKLGRPR